MVGSDTTAVDEPLVGTTVVEELLPDSSEAAKEIRWDDREFKSNGQYLSVSYQSEIKIF